MKQTPDLTQLLSLIRHTQSDLQRRARPLGYRLYADRPRAFTDRIESYWRIWNSRMDAFAGPAE